MTNAPALNPPVPTIPTPPSASPPTGMERGRKQDRHGAKSEHHGQTYPRQEAVALESNEVAGAENREPQPDLVHGDRACTSRSWGDFGLV